MDEKDSEREAVLVEVPELTRQQVLKGFISPADFDFLTGDNVCVQII